MFEFSPRRALAPGSAARVSGRPAAQLIEANASRIVFRLVASTEAWGNLSGGGTGGSSDSNFTTSVFDCYGVHAFCSVPSVIPTVLPLQLIHGQ